MLGKAKVNPWCDGAGRDYGCGNPALFVGRPEDTDDADIFVCGKHLAAALTRTDTRYIVVRVKK